MYTAGPVRGRQLRRCCRPGRARTRRGSGRCTRGARRARRCRCRRWRSPLRASARRWRVRRPERDVCARRDAVSTWLGADRVQREVVARTAPEEDVCIAFELTLAQHRESELGRRRPVHAPTRGKVAHPDADVIDHLTHASPLLPSTAECRSRTGVTTEPRRRGRHGGRGSIRALGDHPSRRKIADFPAYRRRGEIRTPAGLAPRTVFETAAFDRSATPPRLLLG